MLLHDRIRKTLVFFVWYTIYSLILRASVIALGFLSDVQLVSLIAYFEANIFYDNTLGCYMLYCNYYQCKHKWEYPFLCFKKRWQKT